MELSINKRNEIKRSLENCQKFFVAVGDINRQQILLAMLTSPNRENRTIDIAKSMCLSRPAVSHHMQILKDADIVNSRREGKNIYYSLCPDDSVIDEVVALMDTIKFYSKQLQLGGE